MTIRSLKLIMIVLVFSFMETGFCTSTLMAGNMSYQDSEMQFLQSEFKRAVNDGIVLGDDYQDLSLAVMQKMIKDAPDAFSRSQFFIYVDRSPFAGQLIMFCFYDSLIGEIKILGVDKVSTGDPKRKNHFMTPTGIFENRINNFSYRALGTKNDKGWRGLGEKGSRVWDFGWQETTGRKGEKATIRLLMHATDPDFGEPRLGKVDSKGCIRISAKMNDFLDRYGILDKQYEDKKSIKKVSYVLRSDRNPVFFAGKYVLVGDSGEATP